MQATRRSHRSASSARPEPRRGSSTTSSRALGGDARARAREIDLVRFQIAEIEEAQIDDPGEEVALEAEEALLGDAAAHRHALTEAFGAIETGALDAVGVAVAALANREPFAALHDRLRASQAELADLERELRLAVETVSDDPARLEQVRSRRHFLRELGRKYGETLAEVLQFADEARARLVELEGYEARAAALESARRGRERDGPTLLLLPCPPLGAAPHPTCPPPSAPTSRTSRCRRRASRCWWHPAR